jgi:hypothetical protein
MTNELIARYRFMREHAGGWVGHNAEQALALARAEATLEQAVDAGAARIDWEDDDLPYDHGFFSDEEVAAKFESNEWTGPFVCLLYVDDEVVASLSGIVVGQWGTNDPYCRVVAAELASEAEDEIRQALGDARDGRSLLVDPVAEHEIVGNI